MDDVRVDRTYLFNGFQYCLYMDSDTGPVYLVRIFIILFLIIVTCGGGDVGSGELES